MTTAAAHNELGVSFALRGDWSAALDCFRAAAEKDSAAAFYNNACAAALKLGLHDEARRLGGAAVALEPANAGYVENLAHVFEARREYADAASHYARAFELGGDPAVLLRLGAALYRLPRFVAASQVLQAGLARRPEDAAGWNRLGFVACSTGDLKTADRAWREAVRRDPSLHAAHSARLLALHFPEDFSAESIYGEHRRWGAEVESAIAPLPAPRSVRAGRIRLGYLQAHPLRNALAPFTAALYRHHDAAAFEVIRFSDCPQPDPACIGTAELSNHELSALIRKSEIDILIDLCGHSSPSCRLLALAEKPARLQIEMIGYPDTTGLTRVDYRVTDSIADPPGAERRHSERLLRLDPCFLCYTPPDDVPDVTARSQGQPFTFGCFNAFPKLTNHAMRAWARILHEVPDSRLVLKCLEFADPDVRAIARHRCEEAGADAARIAFLEPSRGHREHMGQYGQVDVFLDCFPYNGTTTTCEALWMGVPGVTLMGEPHVARVGASLLSACGLSGWAVTSWDAYVERAVRAARERESIRGSRLTMRERLMRSPLCDGPRYTRLFEALLVGAMASLGSSDPRSSAFIGGR